MTVKVAGTAAVLQRLHAQAGPAWRLANRAGDGAGEQVANPGTHRHGKLPKQDGRNRPPRGRTAVKGSTVSRRSRGADRRRDLAETLGGDHEGTLQQLLVVVDQVGEPPRQHRHGEDLLNAALELEQGDRLAAAQVHDADAARPLLGGEPLGDRDAAEDGRLADLRQPDEGQVARRSRARA